MVRSLQHGHGSDRAGARARAWSEMVHLTFLLCGLFTSWLSFRVSGSSSSFGVIQSPPRISLNEGGCVQISCCWNISSSGFKTKWFQYSRVLSKTHVNTTIRDNCSTLSIPNAAEDDAGFYYCEVTKDIPKLLKVNGTGTHVTIQGTNDLKGTKVTPVISTKEEDAEQDSDELVIFIFRCVPVVTLLLAVCYLNHDLKKKPRETPGSENSSNTNRQERDVEEQGEQVGQEGDVEEQVEELGQEGNVEEQNEQPGQDKALEEQVESTRTKGKRGRARQTTRTKRDVEEQVEQLGQDRNMKEQRDKLGQEGSVKEQGEQLGQDGDVEEQSE
ncbi:uncharacterized protein LOC134312023 [Trichomycterus rosablanca]|uniref:uncharacterized protein LOC134312023 n=1 Tax=Trichomycterus rosablanca TaxID=2290929 RepID=UPI002F351023